MSRLVTTTVRLPSELRKALELEAKSNDRSLNATIVRALREKTLDRVTAGADHNEEDGD